MYPPCKNHFAPQWTFDSTSNPCSSTYEYNRNYANTQRYLHHDSITPMYLVKTLRHMHARQIPAYTRLSTTHQPPSQKPTSPRIPSQPSKRSRNPCEDNGTPIPTLVSPHGSRAAAAPPLIRLHQSRTYRSRNDRTNSLSCRENRNYHARFRTRIPLLAHRFRATSPRTAVTPAKDSVENRKHKEERQRCGKRPEEENCHHSPEATRQDRRRDVVSVAEEPDENRSENRRCVDHRDSERPIQGS